jgi:heptosyltransferase-2
MVLPALKALAEVDPVWLGVAHPRVVPLYRATGLFAELLPARGARAPLQLAPRVRRFDPERALVFTYAMTGVLLARMSGARWRLGRGPRYVGPFLTHRLPAAPRTGPLWREFLELAVAAGARPVSVPDFRVRPDSESEARVSALLEPVGASPVALAPGSAYGQAKRWPLERFITLARNLRSLGRAVVVVGGPEERSLGEALAREGALDLTGRTTLLEAVAVLARCRGLVTNDSGALHLGRAAGTRLVGLFGSSSPRWTGPEPREGEAIWLGLACSPCFKRRCPLGGTDHLRCLRDITVDRVVRAVESGGAMDPGGDGP